MREDEFLLADPVFCEAIESARDDSGFEACARVVPAGWNRIERGVWSALHPQGVTLPAQGWKIHVSTTAQHAEAALAQVWDYCVGAGLSFKMLRTRRLHDLLNAKSASRSSSGKLAALYPVTEDELKAALVELSHRLSGIPGPYVLTDLRWGQGPLYLRYGAFLEQWAASPSTGEPVMVMTRPDGHPEPDLRRPVFQTPDWAPVPGFVQEQIDAAADVVHGDLGYVVERALHSSNGGGVYAGRDRAGRQVVLKEARPHAGLDGHGIDAVARLRHEADVLRRLSGTGVVPELLDELTWWEHRFIVQEYVPGETLHERVARSHPYIYPSPSAEQLREYTDWALDVLEQVSAAVETFHEHGLVFGDLHPANVRLTPQDRVVLVDPELSFDAADLGHRVLLGDPGFRHQRLVSGGRCLDDYALACLRLAVFLPMTSLLYWDPDLREGGKAEQLARTATRLFPLPDGWDERLLADLRRLAGAETPPAPPSLAARRTAQALGQPQRWPALLAETILASATPERRDRLYPTGPQGFGFGPAGIAHGAAGVLHALHQVCPDAVPEAHLEWLAEAAERDLRPYSGLFDGLLGAAVVLAELGRPERALRVLERARPRFGLNRSADLFGGAAGRGLGALRLHALTGSPAALSVAEQAAEELVALLRRPAGDRAGDGLVAPRSGGLMAGWSGPALCLLRAYQAGGDPAYLDLALDAVRRDVERLQPAGGGLHVADDSGRVLLYLSSGSIGVGLVAAELLGALDALDASALTSERAAHAAALRGALHGIRVTCGTEFSVMPGLFEGRAGVLAGSMLLGGPGLSSRPGPDLPGLAAPELTEPGLAAGLERHAADLAWHLVGHGAGLAVPGFGLIRLTMDLATGSAGVLLALNLAQTGSGTLLPALGLTPKPASTPSLRAQGRR